MSVDLPLARGPATSTALGLGAERPGSRATARAARRRSRARRDHPEDAARAAVIAEAHAADAADVRHVAHPLGADAAAQRLRGCARAPGRACSDSTSEAPSGGSPSSTLISPSTRIDGRACAMMYSVEAPRAAARRSRRSRPASRGEVRPRVGWSGRTGLRMSGRTTAGDGSGRTGSGSTSSSGSAGGATGPATGGGACGSATAGGGSSMMGSWAGTAAGSGRGVGVEASSGRRPGRA